MNTVSRLVFLAFALALPCLGETPPENSATEPTGTLEEEIDVVGITPVVGLGLRRDEVPSPVQSASGEDLEGTFGIVDLLDERFAGVQVNDAQGNPLQGDVRFRGFTASPLLGAPQGLAVYQDGVRINEVFGDTVHWDLIPDIALAQIDLFPGSPLFGLNTLGGALSLTTKSGFTHPGHRVELLGGSFGRRTMDLESGVAGESFSLYVGGQYFEEDGWRDFSDSEIRSLFVRADWRGERSSADLTLNVADNSLRGNGAVPTQLLAERREAVYTHPDITSNQLLMPTLHLRHVPSSAWLLEAVLYGRSNDIDTFNGDDRDDDDDGDDDDGGDDGDDDDGGDDGDDDDGGDDGDGDEDGDGDGDGDGDDDDDFNALNNTSLTEQRTWGTSLQATRTFARGRAIFGASYDKGRAHFRSASELATLTGDRGTEGSGIFDPDAFVDLRTRVRHGGIYAAVHLDLGPSLRAQLSGRYNRSAITLLDQLGTALNGDHRFSRFNPSVGLVWRRDTFSVYGSYSQSSRAPTPVELTCADPEDPCRLPNAFVADPPLEQVVTETWEFGVRGGEEGLRWHLGLFRANNRDDLLFISSGTLTNAGHFENVGRTRRQGVEFSLNGQKGPWHYFLNASFTDATFESPVVLSSPNHPEAIGGELAVQSGDRLPGVARMQGKAGLRWKQDRLTFEGTVRAASSQFFRGDEANLLEAIPGYEVFDFEARYQLAHGVALRLEVRNLFDAEYETFGLFGEADEVLGDAFDDPRFLGPGAPRGIWLGLDVDVGGRQP